MRMMILRKTVLAIMALGAGSLFAQRTDHLLDDGWMFRFSHQVEKNSPTPVSLPHTWNAQDALSGKMDYKRGIGNYQRTLYVRPEWKGKRLFLRFEGANSVANVFLNGRHVGEHRGGYSAFVFEITDCVNYGADNRLWVRVNNGEQLDVMPLVGDFNFYGGLYRDVHLVVTEPACISLTDFASPGVYLRQTAVSREEAKVEAVVKLSNGGAAADLQVKVRVCDGDKTVTTAEQSVTLAAGQDGETLLPLTVRRPRLWNGTQDPFSYRAEVTLWADGKEIDRVEQPLGLRFYRIDPAQGFFLNGKHLSLHGVCRHQDRPEIGNALRQRHHEEDIRLMREMGVNAARLAHYQQAEAMYRLTDREGIVVWAEIPFVGPGGYADKGFVDQPSFRANGRQQLRELIRQNFNHPSICMWGLFNELKEEGDNPIPYIKELNALAHEEDTTRPTTAASNQGGGNELHLRPYRLEPLRRLVRQPTGHVGRFPRQDTCRSSRTVHRHQRIWGRCQCLSSAGYAQAARSHGLLASGKLADVLPHRELEDTGGASLRVGHVCLEHVRLRCGSPARGRPSGHQ